MGLVRNANPMSPWANANALRVAPHVGHGTPKKWRNQHTGQGNPKLSEARQPIPKPADANKNQGSKSVSRGASGRELIQPSFTIVGRATPPWQ
jgi:hypothetical protein